MHQFTPEDIAQKLLDLQTAFEKCMSHPKPDMVLANQLRRDITFYTALQREYPAENFQKEDSKHNTNTEN
jgi:hypothetical protein